MTAGKNLIQVVLAVAMSVVAAVSLRAQTEDEEEAPVRSIQVSGTVRDPAGQPVEGVEIIVLKMDLDRVQREEDVPFLAARFPHAPGRSHRGEARPVARLKSGRDGGFSTTLSLGISRSCGIISQTKGRGSMLPLFFMAHDRRVSTSGWFPCCFLPDGSQKAEPILLTVFPRAKLEVRLVDHEGRPLAGERVTGGERMSSMTARMNRCDMLSGYAVPIRWRGTTDETGVVEFFPLPGIDLYVHAPEQGLVTVGDRVKVGILKFFVVGKELPVPLRLAGGETRRFVMKRPRPVRVKGCVKGRDGKPLEGAMLSYLDLYAPPDWRTRTDHDGLFAFKTPLPLGGELHISPVNERRIYTHEVPSEADGDEVEVDIRLTSGPLAVRLDRAGCEAFLSDGNRLEFPVDTEGKGKSTGRVFRFDWWQKKADVVLAATSGDRAGDRKRIGFFVKREVDTRCPEVAVAVPPFTFDATLELNIRPAGGEAVDGTVYLACTGVDRYPGVRVFAEILVPGRSRVRLPELQAGSYILGFIPFKGQKRLFRGPGEPRPVRFPRGYQPEGFWSRHFGVMSRARRNTCWRPLRIEAGKNVVTLDLTESTLGGVLEVLPVDCNGKPVREFQAELTSEENPAVSDRRTGRYLFPADEAGVIRISGVAPGLYEMSVSWCHMAGVLQPAVIPSSGTHRMQVYLDHASPDRVPPPLLVDRSLEVSPEDRAEIGPVLGVREVIRLVSLGELKGAKRLAYEVYRKYAGSGASAGMLMTLIGGTEDQFEGIGFSPADWKLLGKGEAPGTRPSLAGVLDMLWQEVRGAKMYRDNPGFRLQIGLVRLEHLMKHGRWSEPRWKAFQTLAGGLRKDVAGVSYRVQRDILDTLKSLEAQAAKLK